MDKSDTVYRHPNTYHLNLNNKLYPPVRGYKHINVGHSYPLQYRNTNNNNISNRIQQDRPYHLASPRIKDTTFQQHDQPTRTIEIIPTRSNPTNGIVSQNVKNNSDNDNDDNSNNNNNQHNENDEISPPQVTTSTTTTTTNTLNNNNTTTANGKSTNNNAPSRRRKKILSELIRNFKAQASLQYHRKKGGDFRVKWLKRFLIFTGILLAFIIVRVIVKIRFLKSKYGYMIELVDEAVPKIPPRIRSNVGSGLRIAAAVEYPIISKIFYAQSAQSYPQAVVYCTYTEDLNPLFVNNTAEILITMYGYATGTLTPTKLCTDSEKMNLSSRCLACSAISNYTDTLPDNCKINYCPGPEGKDTGHIVTDALSTAGTWGSFIPFVVTIGGPAGIAAGVIVGVIAAVATASNIYENVQENERVKKKCKELLEYCLDAGDYCNQFK